MAVPKKLGPKWIHQVQVAGKRAEQGVATPKGKLGLTKTCADAFEKYELELSKNKRGYRWEAFRLAGMAETDLGKVKMVDLDSTHFVAWRDQRLKQVAPGSVTREMNLLSNVFAVARKEWKWISESPTSDVARPKAPPARNRLISQKEIEAMCVALGWRRDVIDVAPTTKQQRIELIGTVPTDDDFDVLDTWVRTHVFRIVGNCAIRHRKTVDAWPK